MYKEIHFDITEFSPGSLDTVWELANTTFAFKQRNSDYVSNSASVTTGEDGEEIRTIGRIKGEMHLKLSNESIRDALWDAIVLAKDSECIDLLQNGNVSKHNCNHDSNLPCDSSTIVSIKWGGDDEQIY